MQPDRKTSMFDWGSFPKAYCSQRSLEHMPQQMSFEPPIWRHWLIWSIVIWSKISWNLMFPILFSCSQLVVLSLTQEPPNIGLIRRYHTALTVPLDTMAL